MIRWLSITLLNTLIFISFPISVSAATCTNFINHINSDILKYDGKMLSKPLSWMSLSKLEQTLGSTTKSTTSEGLIEYKWTCPQDNSIYLTVTMNTQGRITNIEGTHSDESSAGLFSADIASKKTGGIIINSNSTDENNTSANASINGVVGSSFERIPNTNAVYGLIKPMSSNKHVKYLGKFNDYPGCEEACGADASCVAYTWHNEKTGDYKFQCFGTDTTSNLVPQSDHFTGIRK